MLQRTRSTLRDMLRRREHSQTRIHHISRPTNFIHRSSYVRTGGDGEGSASTEGDGPVEVLFFLHITGGVELTKRLSPLALSLQTEPVSTSELLDEYPEDVVCTEARVCLESCDLRTNAITSTVSSIHAQ